MDMDLSMGKLMETSKGLGMLMGLAKRCIPRISATSSPEWQIMAMNVHYQ